MLGFLIALLLTPHEAPQVLLDRGRKLTVAQRYDEAIWTFGQLMLLEPEPAVEARAHSGRGYAKLKAGSLDGTHADFMRAAEIDLDPKYQALVWNHLGQVDELAANPERAMTEYAKALTFAPNESASAALARLRGHR